MTKKLSGKVALVTGGSRGIGAATARALADEGANVAISYVASPEKAEAVVADLETKGVNAHAFKADQASPADVEQLVADVAKHFGRLDILVNNAGVAVGGAVDDPNINTAALARQDVVNVHGVIAAIRAASKLMGDGGRIVTIGSIAAFRGPATYGGAKAALHPWSAELAVALAPEGISVNVVAPGYVTDTEFYGDRMGPELREDRSGRAPAGRMGKPGEIAALVRYLASPDAEFVTGQILQANGGALLGRG